jgi:hypothetical protein
VDFGAQLGDAPVNEAAEVLDFRPDAGAHKVFERG